MSGSGRVAREQQIVGALAAAAREIGAFGLRAGVVHARRPAEFGSWGVDGRNPDVPMRSSGRFRIGSVTKTFTSALVLDLVDRGALSLADTIEEWAPSFPNANAISIESLLTHTSGTPDMTADAFSEYAALLLADLNRRFTPAEVVALMGAGPTFAEPRVSYRYSNTDYLLLGHITEIVTGASFAELLDRRFTSRLGLDDTTYDDAIPDDLAHGWFDFEFDAVAAAIRDLDARDFPNTALITTAYAAGGMTSTLADLLAWGEALYLGAALSPAMRARLIASPSVPDPATGRRHGYGVAGYGSSAPDGSFPAYGHAGNIVGSSAFVASFPASSVTVAIHANVQEVTTESLIELAFALSDIAASDQ